MVRKSSFIVASLLLGVGLQADSTTLSNAFKNGEVNGDLHFYMENINNAGTTLDSGFSVGSVGLSYETDSYNGFKANMAFRANHNFSEVENGDYDPTNENTQAIMSVANISYENDMFALILGRQAIDLEWMTDFHEAYVGVLKAIPDTTVVVGHTVRMTGDSDYDGALLKFQKVNGNNGASVVDAKYTGFANTVLNGYYYYANNLASWYGLGINYDTDMYGFTAKYTASSEKVNGVADGSIAQLEARGSFKGFDVNAGYITTDSKGGIGSMSTLGDNINPFEEGNQVYSANADTYYLGVSYEINKVTLGALYGDTSIANQDEKELNLLAGYSFSKALSANVAYININTDVVGSAEYNKVYATVSYAF